MNDSLEQQQVEDQEQTTDFRADAPVVVDQPLTQIVNATAYKEGRTHGLMDILERPYEIRSLEWSADDLTGTNLYTFKVNSQWLSATNVKQKTSNFAFIKANFKLRVLANFTPFQTGKVLISAYPNIGFDPQDRGIYSMFQASTFRHVELDVGEQEEVEIELPFLNDVDAWPLQAPHPLGEDLLSFRNFVDSGWVVRIHVMVPLRGSNNNEIANLNVFLMASDIELSMPTSQSKEAVLKQKKGIVSSIAGTVGSVAGSLKAVPPLSSIAGPVEWVAGAVSGIATYFGFSKPRSVAPPQPVVVQPGMNMPNHDGLDSSVNLGLSVDNEVQQMDEPDDMSICEIVKRQGIIKQFDWSYSSPPRALLYSQVVNPQVLYQTDEEIGATIGCPLYFVSRMFNLWQGDVTFRFSFAKNRFYSGKLMVSFQPIVKTSTAPYSDNLYRRVISLKESSEFTITIPYVFPKPWCRGDEFTGVLSVTVLNRLQATDTVSDTITCNVWAWSNNMKFAVPAPQLGRTILFPHLFKQGQSINSMIQNTSTGVQDNLFPSNQQMNEQYTVGEVIENLRVLTRRFQFMGSGHGNLAISSASIAERKTLPYEDFVAGFSDIFHHLGQAYAFMRGGLRVKRFSARNNGVGFIQQIDGYGFGPEEEIDMGQKLTSGANMVVLSAINGAIEAQVPFYGDRARWYCNRDANTVPGSTRFNFGFLRYADNGTFTVDNYDSLFYVASADDFTFSLFIGVPFMKFST